jgi:E3 ubiquitin-protein ligase UBR7
MFQCLGLGTAKDGGCGEDWYHAGCVVGLGPTWYEDQPTTKTSISGPLETVMEDAPAVVGHERETNDNNEDDPDDDEIPPPPGFPNEDEFEGFICYKCVDANPWIKRYAGTDGFLEPVFRRSGAPSPETKPETKINPTDLKAASEVFSTPATSRKRKSEDAGGADTILLKRVKDGDLTDNKPILTETTERLDKLANEEIIETGVDAMDADTAKPDVDPLDHNTKFVHTDTTGTPSKLGLHTVTAKPCKYESLPPAPEGTISLFLKSSFRDHLCHCSSCFPRLAPHPQLLEEEEAYEPPVSSDGGSGAEGSTHGSGGSLLDRGERALTNVDRVRAIEGVMAYNHLKEKLKPFFKEFAESGKAISAEDIKAHFAKIRGDEEAIRQAAAAVAGAGNGDGDDDHRREQSGY